MKINHIDFLHLDRLRTAIFARLGGEEKLRARFPLVIRGAVEYVLDPIRTARTTIAELDNVEKTFVGLKVEHFIRDMLDVPKGVRDLVIDGVDVDVKNTVGATWMIPKETYETGGPVLLVVVADSAGHCSLGLLLAKQEYLGSENRDKKRSILAAGKQSIMWLVEKQPFPKNRWEGIDMECFRTLRTVRGGSRRVAEFFSAHLNVVVHREVVQALLHPQLDPMKRLRTNGGARDLLAAKGIELLSGSYDAKRIATLSKKKISGEEFVAIRTG